MNRPILVSMVIGVAAIAGSAEPIRALCIDNDARVMLQRDVPPEDNSFVRSGPASGDTNFTFELELGSDLNLFSTEPAADADAIADETDAPIEDAEPEANSAPSEEIVETPTIFSLEEDSSSADDLDTVELGEPSLASREDYLDSRARQINNCFE